MPRYASVYTWNLKINSMILYGQVIGKKPSWKIGSSFPLKKTSQVLPKVQIDDDLDLIDEDSLLTEEDLKKPQLPAGEYSSFYCFNYPMNH